MVTDVLQKKLSILKHAFGCRFQLVAFGWECTLERWRNFGFGCECTLFVLDIVALGFECALLTRPQEITMDWCVESTFWHEATNVNM